MSMSVATTGAPSTLPDAIVSCDFGVTLDGKNLGRWTEVDLGGLDVAVETLEEGGNAGFIHQLPGRLNYQHIKLTRIVDPSTSLVAAWFASMTGAIKRTTGEIVAYDTERKPAISWKFIDAIPVRWTLPTLGVDGPKGWTEVLELAHQGFVG